MNVLQMAKIVISDDGILLLYIYIYQPKYGYLASLILLAAHSLSSCHLSGSPSWLFDCIIFYALNRRGKHKNPDLNSKISKLLSSIRFFQ